MPANLILSDDGVQFAGGAIVDVKASIPTSGTWNAGSIVLESTTFARVSGWKRLTTGSGHVLNTDWRYFTNIASGTAVATTSGTSIDFTGIPAEVKRVTLNINGVSTTGLSELLVQAGNGSPETSGYISGADNSGAAGIVSSTSGFIVTRSNAAAALSYGNLVMTNMGGNVWVYSSSVYNTIPRIMMGGGSKTFSGVVERLRLTTVGGTDTFDLGSANILWEF
jgi:hypothetical protein